MVSHWPYNRSRRDRKSGIFGVADAPVIFTGLREGTVVVYQALRTADTAAGDA